jgi:predicted DNA-binding mobile mystery protein A
MRREFSQLRLKQLDRALAPFKVADASKRPPTGWIRAIRQALGVSSSELGRRMGTSRQHPPQLEEAEAQDRITLKSLRAVAAALDCDLVYALIPRAETLANLVENRARLEATRRVLSVEHSMALEDQAVGNIEEAVDAETRRLAQRRKS